MEVTAYVKLAALVAVAYFLGNISPATLIGQFFGIDIKQEGSGNAGTTNVLRVLGWQAALVTLFIDIFKGWLAVILAEHSFGNLGAMLGFAAVVLGHVYPLLFYFKGGKGVATAFGAACAVNWPSAFAVLLVALFAVLASRKMSAGSVAAAIAYPLLILYYYPRVLPMAVVMAVFILYTHRSNIARLARGEEPELKIGHPPAAVKEAAHEGAENPRELYPLLYSSRERLATADHISFEHPALAIDPEPVDFYVEEPEIKLSKEEKRKVAVIGNGSFGTAIANVIAHNGHAVMVYGRNREAIDRMRETHINERYLPGAILSAKIKYTNYLRTAARGRDIVIFAVPAQQFVSVAQKAAKYLTADTVVVNLAKGIDSSSLKTMSKAAKGILKNPYVVLSGPSHAEEIVRNYPTTVVAASAKAAAVEAVQGVLMSPKFRVYTGTDVLGVELGGALKNVIAIGTGIADGMGLGDNTKAGLMTRGIHEISRLGEAMGAKSETFSGLSGIGDLMVTCSSDLSRNRRCGILIGQGKTPEEAVEEIGSTVEGFYTVDAACRLAKRKKIELPITEAVAAVIDGQLDPKDAVSLLMGREGKEENE